MVCPDPVASVFERTKRLARTPTGRDTGKEPHLPSSSRRHRSSRRTPPDADKKVGVFLDSSPKPIEPGGPLSREVPRAYEERLEVARNFLRRERTDHTLQPTALVHEAYLRLVRDRGTDRAELVRAAAGATHSGDWCDDPGDRR
jgi:hypothetical protein